MLSALRRRHGRELAGNEDGFTIVEVLASLVVLALVAAAAGGVLIRTLALTGEGRMRATAANLAEREKEVSLGLGYDALLPGTVATPLSVNGDAFTVTRTISLLPGTSTTSSCSAPDGARLAYKKISVLVTWPRMGSVTPVQSDTVLAVPIGQVNGNLGAFAVPVVDRNSVALQGINVTLSPTGATAVSDKNGCAVFTSLAPGTYSASVDTIGYVGITNAQSVSTTAATVVAGRIAKPASLMYDQASALTMAWSPPGGGYQLPISGHGVQVERSLLGQTVFNPYCSPVVTSGCLLPSGAMSPVFPWAGAGYGLSAGRCLPASGEGVGLPDPRGYHPRQPPRRGSEPQGEEVRWGSGQHCDGHPRTGRGRPLLRRRLAPGRREPGPAQRWRH